MDLHFVPMLDSLTEIIENDAELSVYEIAICHITYTMLGDAITTSVHVRNEGYTYIHNIMPSDEWNEDGPWGSESMKSDHVLSLKELIYVIEVINTESRFSHFIREAIEELIDHNLSLDSDSLKDNCEFSSDVYPDLPIYYDSVGDYIISHWKEYQQLPDDDELQKHITNTLQ